MTDVGRLFDNLAAAIVAADEDFQVIYANEACKKLFKELLNAEGFVGKSMQQCHKPETREKMERLYQEYRDRTRKLDYYVMDIPGGKATIVNVPVYKDGEFKGVVEFIFESSLA